MFALPDLHFAFRPRAVDAGQAGPPLDLVESVDPAAVPVAAAFLDVPAASQRAVAAFDACRPGGADWVAALHADVGAATEGRSPSAVATLLAVEAPHRYGAAAALLRSEAGRLAVLRQEHADVLAALAVKAGAEVAALVDEVKSLLPTAWQMRGRSAGIAAWEGKRTLSARVGRLRALIDWCDGGSGFDEHRPAMIELDPVLMGYSVACRQHYDNVADPRVWDSGAAFVLPDDYAGPNVPVEVDVSDGGVMLRRSDPEPRRTVH